MPPIAQLSPIGRSVLFFLGAQLGRASGFGLIFRICRTLAKGSQQAGRALELVFVQDPDGPSLLLLIVELVLDALHVKVIGERTGGRSLRQMANQTHKETN